MILGIITTIILLVILIFWFVYRSQWKISKEFNYPKSENQIENWFDDLNDILNNNKIDTNYYPNTIPFEIRLRDGIDIFMFNHSVIISKCGIDIRTWSLEDASISEILSEIKLLLK